MHPADVWRRPCAARAPKTGRLRPSPPRMAPSESAVKKLLALGGVSPTLMQLFRDGKIKMDEMQALAFRVRLPARGGMEGVGGPILEPR